MTLAAGSLEDEVRAHRAVRHVFLERFRLGGLGLEQQKRLGLQHYQLVRVFTTYMTNLLSRRPDWAGDLRPILSDEFGGHSIFASHVHLYRGFLKSMGLTDAHWGRAEKLPETRAFIDGHLALTREGDPLEALGALGPGHEHAIPSMFASLLEGLSASQPDCKDLAYFVRHIQEDKEHAARFHFLIQRAARGASQLERVRRGALMSLELRARFWDGLDRALFGGYS